MPLLYIDYMEPMLDTNDKEPCSCGCERYLHDDGMYSCLNCSCTFFVTVPEKGEDS